MRNILNKYNTVFRSSGQAFPTANGTGQSFNGIDQYAYVVDNGALDINQAVTDFCFGGWFKSNSNGLNQYILGKFPSTIPTGTYGFYKNSSNVIKLHIQTSTGDVAFYTGIDGNNDVDSHLFIVRIDLINSKIYLYVDTVLINAGGTSFTGTFSSLSDDFKFYVGSGQNSGGNAALFANTEILDVRIYHKDITSADNQNKWLLGKGLGDEIAWWNLPTLTGFGGTDYNLTGVNL